VEGWSRRGDGRGVYSHPTWVPAHRLRMRLRQRGGGRREAVVFEQDFDLEDAIGSHACSLETSVRMTNAVHLGSPLLLRLSP
jgi:hypothetical protein